MIVLLARKLFSKSKNNIQVKPILFDGITSIICIAVAFILFFAITYQHPETMVSLGSQWNTSLQLSQVQQLFIQEGSINPLPSMVVPFHGLIAFLASLFDQLPSNGLPTVLRLFSVLYFSISLEIVVYLGKRFKFQTPQMMVLLIVALVLLNNVYDLYFPFVADVWLWMILPLMLIECDDSLLSSVWKVAVTIFCLSFGTTGALITATCVLWQFEGIDSNNNIKAHQIIAFVVESILFGFFISTESLVLWIVIAVALILITCLSKIQFLWRFIHGALLICAAFGAIGLIVTSLDVQIIENFTIIRSFLSNETMIYEALILSCVSLLIGIFGCFKTKNSESKLSFFLGITGLITAVILIFNQETPNLLSLLLTSICMNPLLIGLLIIKVTALEKSSVYLSGVVLCMLFCSTIPWQNPTYDEGMGNWEDFDHINRMTFAESEIYSAMQEDMEQYQDKEGSFRIISQAPFTQAVFFEDEIVHSYLDYINTCQYCDVEALDLHEPSALFNIFVPRDYSDNRLFIEMPQFKQACALLNENDIDYIIYESGMNTDESMQWLSMKDLLNGCTTIITENQRYVLARVNQEVSR